MTQSIQAGPIAPQLPMDRPDTHFQLKETREYNPAHEFDTLSASRCARSAPPLADDLFNWALTVAWNSEIKNVKTENWAWDTCSKTNKSFLRIFHSATLVHTDLNMYQVETEVSGALYIHGATTDATREVWLYKAGERAHSANNGMVPTGVDSISWTAPKPKPLQQALLLSSYKTIPGPLAPRLDLQSPPDSPVLKPLQQALDLDNVATPPSACNTTPGHLDLDSPLDSTVFPTSEKLSPMTPLRRAREE